MNKDVTGVFAAASTPFNADLTPDHGRLAAHCRKLLADGCHGIAVLGTTGEANSLALGERKAILEAMLKAGITPNELAPGVGVTAVTETIELTRHALSLGVAKVLVLPPFYYKDVSDEGLFATYARIIEAVGDDRLRLILYHIPQTSAVPLSHDLVARLLAAFPGIVAGIKDSSGDFSNQVALAKSHPQLSVLTGTDPLMLPLLRAGGAGCITAVANLDARSLRFLFDNFRDEDMTAEVEEAQARLVAWRALTNIHGALLGAKALLEITTGDDGWRRVRPPLVSLSDGDIADLRKKLPA